MTGRGTGESLDSFGGFPKLPNLRTNPARKKKVGYLKEESRRAIE